MANFDRPDVVDRILAAAATILLALVAVALIKGAPHWNSVSPVVWAHLMTVVLAVLIAPIQLLRRRGDRIHRVLGRIWAATIFITAAISFDIREINAGNFSPIHALSLLALVLVPMLIWAARTGRISTHRGIARGMILGALVIAGTFTLLPSRILGGWLFG